MARSPSSTADQAATASLIGRPLLTRIAGVPASYLSHFSRPQVDTDYLEPRRRLMEQARIEREELVDLIYQAIGSRPPAERAPLLALKRDVFNGRPVTLERAQAELEDLDGSDQMLHLAASLIEKDSQLGALATAFEESAAEALVDARRHLVRLMQDAELRHGVALSSRLTVKNLYRLERADPKRFGKRERRLEASSIRFISRAAAKTSPYSTLTRTALGVVAEKEAGRPWLGGHGADWRRHPRLRLKRFLPEADLAVLTQYEPFFRGLKLSLNSTIEPLGDGRFQFLRPVLRVPKDGRIMTFPAVMLSLKIPSPGIIEWIEEVWRGGAQPGAETLSHDQLLARLDVEDAERSAAFIRQLLGVGFLSWVYPWPSHAIQVESDIYRYLEENKDDAGLAEVAGRYGELLEAMAAVDSSVDPVADLEQLDRAIDKCWQSEIALVEGVEGERSKLDVGNYYQDVHLTAAGAGPGDGKGSPWREIFHLPKSTAGRLDDVLQLIWRYGQFLHRRHELLHTVAGFMRKEWPGRTQVPVLELFVAFRGLWKEFSAWDNARLLDHSYEEIFNPLDLPEIEALHISRQKVIQHLRDALVADGVNMRIDPAALAAALAEVPEAYAPPVGYCAFLQPVDTEGTTWVLNQLEEGTGRFGARYVAVMPDGVAEEWVDFQRRRPPARLHGEEAPWLDLLTLNSDTLNVHAVQTESVLVLPGDRVDWPAEKTLTLQDLNVRLPSEPGRTPVLVDRGGQIHCPVYLGGTGIDFSPPILELLSRFGPGECWTPIIPLEPRPIADGRVWPRLSCGPLVWRRRRWRFPKSKLGEPKIGEPGPSTRALNEWRGEREIPRQAFLSELVAANRLKPQYMDFSSPIFLPVMRSVWADEKEEINLTEALPKPENAPMDEGGERWSTEIQFEMDLQEHGR